MKFQNPNNKEKNPKRIRGWKTPCFKRNINPNNSKLPTYQTKLSTKYESKVKIFLQNGLEILLHVSNVKKLL